MLGRTIAALRRDRGFYPLSALAIVAAIVIVAVAYWRLIGPTYLTIAVAPPQGEEAKLLDAFAATLVNGRRGVRIEVHKEKTLETAADRLEAGHADLAAVRPDVRLPANGLTVAILRREALIILHPSAQKIDGPADLAGKSLAVIERDEADASAVQALLEFYDVAARVRVGRIAEGDVASALAGGRFAAAAFLATPGSPEAVRVARAIASAFGKPVSLVKISGSEAFAASRPVYSQMKIPSGGVLANPATPAEEAETIGVSWRLMARQGLDRGPISTLTERLFESRSGLARQSRAAITMKAPDSDDATSAVLPNHRGALDYFNREQLTFMDRYGDWLWFSLFAAGGVSSAFAWIGRMFRRRRREVVDEALTRLCRLLTEARKADSLPRLAEISAEIDRLVAISVWRVRRRTTDARTMGALMIVIEAARAAARERREELTQSNAGAINPPL
ncbi:MAG: TAXI family TRAP transporter solute-binding subunit [Beijerinckiaceae bacterium]